MKGTVSELLFRYSKTQRVCNIFLEWLKKKGGEASRSEVSRFAFDLQDGKIVKGFTYRRENFYRIVLKRLIEFGFIGKETRYPRRIVYAPIIQPIPSRGPPQSSWWGLAYLIAEKWNQEFAREVDRISDEVKPSEEERHPLPLNGTWLLKN